MSLKHSILILISSSALALANSGKEVYTMFCSACHGADGLGVANAAPPLAGSEWVTDSPERMVQILLHGLQGKITVKGAQYNLVMPPQAALNHEQIAAVTNYVRTSWGNKGEAINASLVAKEQAKFPNQNGMWDANKLLKAYPLSNTPIKIEHLLSHSYNKHYRNTLDLTGRKPDAVEEEDLGFIDPSQGGKKNDNFAVIWSGHLEAKEAGEYEFALTSWTPSSLHINGELFIDRNRIQQSKRTMPSVKSITLPKGKFEIEARYIHYKKRPLNIQLTWTDTTGQERSLHNTQAAARVPRVILTPDERPIIHRNFVADLKSARGLMAGFPEGVHFAFDASHLSMNYLWTGKFADAGLTWTGRGRGEVALPIAKQLHPLSKAPSFAVLEDLQTVWPSAFSKDLAPQFKGYELDQDGRPTLLYKVAGLNIKDKPTPIDGGFSRQLTLSGSPNEQLYFQIAENQCEKVSDGLFKTTSGTTIKITTPDTPIQHRANDLLLGPISQPSSITIEYATK